MGKGGQKHDATRTYTWDEVKSHDSRDDRWLVIGGEIYDVSNWSKKHPGGSRIISHFVGQDASEAFRNFHNDAGQTQKYLKSMHKGSVSEYKDREIDSDFRELKETVTKLGYFKPSITFFALTLAEIVLWEALSYFTLLYFGTGWLPYLAALMLYATCQSQTAWNQHDYGHLSVFGSTWLNHAFHKLTLGFISGGSATWWNHMHFQHHGKPNVIGKDPDVRVEALFVVGEEMSVTVAKSRKKSMPFNLQQWYFFILGPPMLFPVYFQYTLFRHVITRKNWLELAIVGLYFMRLFYMFGPVLGIGWTIAFFFTARMVASMWFVWVAQSNHVPMSIRHDQEYPWLKLQLYATCNVEKSFFNDWFTGHLNFQIEHHLFPTMPRHNLYKTTPLVKSLCKKHGIPYIVKPMSQAFSDIVKTLKQSGEVWAEAYHQAHHMNNMK